MSVNQGNVTPNNDPNGQNPADGAEDKPPVWLIITVVVLGLAIIGMLVVIVMKVLIGDKGDENITTDTVSISEKKVKEPSKEFLSLIENSWPEYLEKIEVDRPVGGKLVASTVDYHSVILTFQLKDGSDVIMIVNRNDGSVDTISIPLNPS
ncbi:hypothetical protein [Kordiimonas sp. SCSIO 12610]|uniref:hypothetical protein n=1 Tax=Kordiimonas sp. SCSIO 12610 TaxID=2829597 RepID=UPI00210BE2E1|nr:hypothetical protein [Kordiimonas sp. SCSIO 12610]UTW56467.1 hypothetical protein KFF44_06075 [Kordiimonas sp. SCSIO 12610]